MSFLDLFSLKTKVEETTGEVRGSGKDTTSACSDLEPHLVGNVNRTFGKNHILSSTAGFINQLNRECGSVGDPFDEAPHDNREDITKIGIRRAFRRTRCFRKIFPQANKVFSMA